MDKKQTEGICVVYVAGPYRAPTEWKTRKNIERSADKAMEVWRLNRDGETRVIPVAPCLNSAFFGGEIPDECYLHGDLALLLRCDAMIVADGWESSRGVRAEIRFAEENGIAVLYSILELDAWMRGRGRTPASERRADARA
jgi:hypothetical protein